MRLLLLFIFFTITQFYVYSVYVGTGLVLQKDNPEILDSAFYILKYKNGQHTLKDEVPFIVIDIKASDIENIWSVYYNLFLNERDTINIDYMYNKKSGEHYRFGGDENAFQAMFEAKRKPMSVLDECKFGKTSKIFMNRAKEKIMTIDDGLMEGLDIYNLFRITKVTLTVLNYVCQKTTISFRGRNYIVWFTLDIPPKKVS